MARVWSWIRTAFSSKLFGPALIAALALLVGTSIGGLISWRATKDVSDTEHERQTAAEGDLLLGTARVMIADFDEALWGLCYMGKHQIFLNFRRPLRSQLSLDDRRRIAFSLPKREWQLIAAADARLAAFDALNREYRGQALDRKNEGIEPMIRKVQAARRSLSTLAGYSDEDSKYREKCPEMKYW